MGVTNRSITLPAMLPSCHGLRFPQGIDLLFLEPSPVTTGQLGPLRFGVAKFFIAAVFGCFSGTLRASTSFDTTFAAV